jgi:prepilin-type N-terminal cleavage/methylation domain-containing protein
MRRSRKRRGGFTLIEILVATVLLSGSLVAIVKLWSVSRSITEQSRNVAEYYVIARQEVEKVRVPGVSRFDGNGFNSAASLVRLSDYDQNGNLLSEAVTSLLATPTPLAYYRVRSTFTLVSTNSSPEPEGKRLGVQKVEVFVITGHTGFPRTGTTIEGASATPPKPAYETATFFAAAGV